MRNEIIRKWIEKNRDEDKVKKKLIKNTVKLKKTKIKGSIDKCQ